MSNRCKKKCVDEFKNFCPVSNYQGGYCCDKKETCPKSNICSYDNPRAPSMFKYLTCPNEAACGSKNLYPKYDGEVLTRMVDKYNE